MSLEQLLIMSTMAVGSTAHISTLNCRRHSLPTRMMRYLQISRPSFLSFADACFIHFSLLRSDYLFYSWMVSYLLFVALTPVHVPRYGHMYISHLSRPRLPSVLLNVNAKISTSFRSHLYSSLLVWYRMYFQLLPYLPIQTTSGFMNATRD